tara:strand:+ start:3083 stop:3748 length:666 start_codon:yes stop_codon:yes gene_type:complete
MNSNNFLTNNNKQTLWDVMYQNGFFNNINQDPLDIRKYFETEMNTIENSNSNLSVVEKNKKILLNMKSYLDNNKTIQQQEIITAEQIIKQRQDNFTNNLNRKQQEFDDIIKKQIPKDINFSDESEESNENIDNLLEKAKRNRENQLNMVFNNNNNNVNLINIGNTIDNISNEHIELIETETEMETLNKDNKLLLQIDKKNDIIIDLLNKIQNLINDKDAKI